MESQENQWWNAGTCGKHKQILNGLKHTKDILKNVIIHLARKTVLQSGHKMLDWMKVLNQDQDCFTCQSYVFYRLWSASLWLSTLCLFSDSFKLVVRIWGNYSNKSYNSLKRKSAAIFTLCSSVKRCAQFTNLQTTFVTECINVNFCSSFWNCGRPDLHACHIYLMSIYGTVYNVFIPTYLAECFASWL